jgi:asparagine synthase (glutamine-hydrolysing)
MCGVAGAFGRTPSTLVSDAALSMTRALVHRGPDGEGFWCLGADGRSGLVAAERLGSAAVVLGHRRLSIVDLDGGAQPMANEDGTIWVSFNGEIYNHLELRSELERSGHRFRSQADTEVLVHGWEEWGARLLGRLNGIFAFALADVKRREVVLARDPMGVKPLYVGCVSGVTWWSSELLAAERSGLTPEAVSSDALKLFLTFRFVPSPSTIYDGVWKLPPAHFCRIGPDTAGATPRFERYDSTIRSTLEPRGRAQWREALTDELARAVERQLMADVPVASLLSGGVDSSLVTHLMTERLPYVPRAFGIGFASDGDRSELLASRRAATAIGVPLVETSLEDADYVGAWPAAVAELGEPVANQSAPMVRLICRQVGRTHKVALCGQGADEPLGGYPRHAAERLQRLGRLSPALAARLTGFVFGADAGRRLSRSLGAPTRLDRYVQIFSVLPPETVDRLVPGASATALELAREAMRRWVTGEPGRDPVNDLLAVDMRLSLADDLLIVGDRMAMASSVELRVPFLDLSFVELVERMPSIYKISRLGERKWLYRQAAARRLPHELARVLCPPRKRFERKRGFSAPTGAWFDQEGGLLSEPARWASPLFELPELDSAALTGVLASGAPDVKRRQTALYSLAAWRRAKTAEVREVA